MKSQVWLLEAVLRDAGRMCGVDVSRDIITVMRRVESEGESFLTITLPTLAQGFERALAQGKFTSDLATSFKRRKASYPVFLSGFFVNLFHEDGRLRDFPVQEFLNIQSIRQICLTCKKVEIECTDVRKRKAEKAFVATEAEIRGMKPTPESLKRTFKKVSAIVMAECLDDTFYEDLIPRHGPGSTQEKILGNKKNQVRVWHTRLERFFPFTEFGLSSVRAIGEDDCPLAAVDFRKPRDEAPVRVTFVPKTLKSPRVIALEPVCMQYAQQAVLQWLIPRIERRRSLDGRKSIAGGQVNFTDQSINQRLALQASKDGRLATVDLSEASDRVTALLVRDLLAIAPEFRELVFSCRSTRADLPSGKTIHLRKFASMGSALCFPMEAMVFFCAIVSSRLHAAKLPITRANIFKYSREVYVYGDDLIIPADETPSICADLEAFGLKVNAHKTFWNGKFRESCGVDAYNGEDVSVVYCRQTSPQNRADVKQIESWVAMANRLYMRGYTMAAEGVKEAVELALRFRLPHADTIRQGLAWTWFSDRVYVVRRNSDLQRAEVRTYVASQVKYPDSLTGDGALLKCLRKMASSLGSENFFDIASPDLEHLLRSVKRGASTLKLRWVPLF